MKQRPKWYSAAVLLIFTENDDPSFITQETGIQSTRLNVKGKPRITNPDELLRSPLRSNLIHPDNCWEYEVRHEIEPFPAEYSDLDAPVKTIISFIESNEEKFRPIFSKYPSKRIELELMLNDYHLYLHLDNKLMEQISRFGLVLNIDAYVLSKSSQNNT
jgi:hypothetical protein